MPPHVVARASEWEIHQFENSFHSYVAYCYSTIFNLNLLLIAIDDNCTYPSCAIHHIFSIDNISVRRTYQDMSYTGEL